MQDRYTADVGDFGKYGLLRALSGYRPAAAPTLRLGVVWYLTDPVMAERDPVNDGRHIGYLRSDQSSRYRPCDPDLYDAMADIIHGQERRVATVTECGVLGPDAAFYESHLRTPKRGERRAQREAARAEWLRGAMAATAGCDVIFVDPDNGLEARSVRPHHMKAPKYVYLSELPGYIERGQSLVIYHHLGRTGGSHNEQMHAWSARLASQLELAQPPLVLRYRRGTARAYFILPAPAHDAVLRERVHAFLHSPWQAHFELAVGE